MKNKIKYTVFSNGPTFDFVVVCYEGTKLYKYWNDAYLKQLIEDAIDSWTSDDVYESANYIYTYINQGIKRRYSGQELTLSKVTVSDVKNEFAIEVEK